MSRHGVGYRKQDLQSHQKVIEKYLRKKEEEEKMREFFSYQSKMKSSLLFPIK